MIPSPSSLELLEESKSMIYPSLVQAVRRPFPILAGALDIFFIGLGAAANQVRLQ
jgi:hypothetical protein